MGEIAPCSSKGVWPRSGSLCAIAPTSLQVLAVKPAEDGSGDIVLRVRETAGRPARATISWRGAPPISLGIVPANAIATWRISGIQGAAPRIRETGADEA